ncbi:MAG: hypothetical protein JST54_35225 [Deltaproteobacteria bacterium]|nr:hypothetical protein [Deltaproteobacteria bacterium]
MTSPPRLHPIVLAALVALACACGGHPTAAPSCTDHQRNGTETDIDCGGSCGPCGDGKLCGTNSDCVSGLCASGTCQTAATPTIRDFSATPTLVSTGATAQLMADFSGGAGRIDPGIGAVTSGAAVSTGALTQTTTFTLTVTNALGAQVSQSVTVQVAASPTIQSFTAAPTTVTAGATSSLTAVFAGGTGTVDHGIGAVTSGAAVSTAALTQDTTFTLTVANAAGEPVTQSVTVHVAAAPAISGFTASPDTVTAGASSGLTAVFSGGTGSIDHGIGAVTSGVAVNTAALTQNTTFTLTVTNPAGTQVTQTVTVQVVAAPTITSFVAAPQLVTAGTTASLTAVFSGGTGAIDQGIGAVTSGVAVNTAPLTQDTTFTLTVTNAAGATVTQTVTVQVVAAPVISAFTASPASVTVGDTSALTATFTGGTGSIDQGLGAVSSGTPITTAALAQDTTFTLTVTNAAGTSVTQAVTVTTIAAPQISSFTAAAPVVTVGSGTSLTGVFSGGTGAVDQGIGAVTSGTPASTGALSQDTTFTLTVTNALGRTATSTVTVSAVAAPSISSFTAASSRVSTGGSTSLTAVFSGGTASIDQGVGAATSGTAVGTGPLSTTTTFTLTVTNAAGATATTTVTVDVGPVGLAWVKRAGCPNCGGVYPWTIAALDDESVVATGIFAGYSSSPTDQVVFGPGEPNQTTLVPPTGMGEIWLGRFAADGSLMWAKRAGGNSDDHGMGVAVLDGGPMLVTGEVVLNTVSGGNVVFGAGEPNQTAVANTGASQTEYIARFNPADGTFLSLQLGGGSTTSDRATGDDIAPYPDGSYTVCGGFTGNATFGAGTPNATSFAAGAGYFMSLLHFDASGDLLWAKAYGTAASNNGLYATRCRATSTGGLWVAGSVSGSVTLGTTTLTAQGYEDVFLGLFDAAGNPLNALSGGVSSSAGPSNRYAWLYGLAVAPDDSALVTGAYQPGASTGGTFTFGGSSLSSSVYASSGIVARVGTDGTLQWMKQVVPTSSGSIINLTAALVGSSLDVFGGFSLGATFGPGEPNQTTLSRSSSNDSVDMFIAEYDPATGSLNVVRRVSAESGTTYDSPTPLALGLRPDGALIVGGEFVGTLLFGPDDPAPATVTAVATDMFLAAWYPY